MCGFLSYLAFNREDHPSSSWVEGMLATIAHRGPDDDGILIDGPAALGFRRLAILDLSSAGHQPMSTRDERLSMVYNGEIYNYLEIRQELESLGHTFRSSGDSEVLLASYRQWGTDCVDRFVGMFAFCIFDRDAGHFFVARDRFGVKPLYFIRSARGVLFASEPKVIRKSGLWDGQPNLARFATFIALNRSDVVPESDETYMTGVHQVLPGHTCTVTMDGRISHRAYWTPPCDTVAEAPTQTREYLERFDDAMRLHIRSDVPVGVMLSGGLDSVSIACSLATLAGDPALRTQPLHAFSYMSDNYDEREQVADTVSQTGLQMHVLKDMDATRLWQQLDALMWYHDEPVHSASVLVGFELYRMAASHGIRVVLSGQGADETTGGYPYLSEYSLVSLARSGRLPALMTQARAIAGHLDRDLGAVLARCARMWRGDMLSRVGAYRRIAAGRNLQNAQGLRYLNPGMHSLLVPHVDAIRGNSLSAELRRATVSSPLPQYLRVEDRNAMAHSVESRVPFLDHRLAEFALRLPLEWKLWDGWNKRILRESMRGRIPESVRARRAKFGFPTAARDWFSGPLAGQMKDLVTDSAAVRSGWFDRSAVEAALNRHLAGQSDETNLLFNVAQLDSWIRLHEAGWTR